MPATIRATVGDLLDTYQRMDGCSPDEHHDEVRQHPMAEAKYILACVDTFRSSLMSEDELATRMVGSFARLEAHRLDDTGHAGWGLGFAYGAGSADETYVITTTLVVHALHSVTTFAPAAVPPGWIDLLRSATDYLLHAARVGTPDGDLIAYSPRNDLPTYNVTAMWSGVLSEVLGPDHPDGAGIRQVANDLLGRRIPGGGWTYGPGSIRADLLHTCYTGVGLTMALPDQIDALDRMFLEDILRFSSTPVWFDRYDLHTVEDLLAGEVPGLGRGVHVVNGNALVGFDAPARSWSMGELLVVISEAAARPTTGRYWMAQLRRLARSTTEVQLPENWFRHSMHIAHGLASALRVLRADQGSS
ncbi:hypothetical protein EXU48_07925 [Occultella glacieicola]|uniref:Uncharacterized protein n=1 Tax=Occultella glacieicola TaxID=2518684 RepID=A0ABY2EA69_9MICO|nr:hypothetical protein [Occultella glacieicola]TDE96150.1 hypothetical protein EXU48_07925 [Occultella glacieicola]